MSQQKVLQTKNIQIQVGLDEQNIPVHLQWLADDQQGSAQECKAFLLSMFDKESKDTLKIDLWTNEMQVVEMDRFFYQTLRALADTYYKATGNQALAGHMQQFATYFGESTEIIPKSEQ